MTNKHFDAIISKNAIAQEIGDHYRTGEDCKVNPKFVLFHLKEIEKYLGQGNQPSVDNVVAGEAVAPF